MRGVTPPPGLPGSESSSTGCASRETGCNGSAALRRWAEDYPLPQEASEASMPEKKFLYSPPKSDAVGVSVAVAVISLWLCVWYHALFQVKLPGSSWWDIASTFVALEFLYSGLFITTHDAMHGTISYKHRWLNDLLGNTAISLYAFFDYSMLHKKHWEHHGHTGVAGKDPDFHGGRSTNPLLWYARFMAGYTTWQQMARMGVFTQALKHLAGVPDANMAVFMLGCGLLSSARLFYFGTYLPHRSPRADPSEVMPWEASASSSAGRLLSFLTCYHFDYHWEHHRWPYAPWWQLPLCKQLRASTAPHSKAAAAAAAAHQQPGGWKTTASQAG